MRGTNDCIVQILNMIGRILLNGMALNTTNESACA